ncbi:hypothetical protein BC629DRAFT_1171599 [Irpex lacteus]|nr:hypothetical protein BC629DRAFT_1171599 [Irpex lacteus]
MGASSSSISTPLTQSRVSSYLTAVTQTLSLVNMLAEQCGQPVAFALFDSKLDQLQLPILPPPTDPAGASERDSTRAGPRRESVAELVRRYFGWIGTIEDANADDVMHAFRLTRIQTNSFNDDDEVVWRYKKRVDDSGYVTYDFQSIYID